MSIPAELFEHILSYADVNTLKSFSTVSSFFTHLCRQHLFHKLHIHENARPEETLSRQACAYVHELCLHLSPEARMANLPCFHHTLATTLRYLIKVHTFRIYLEVTEATGSQFGAELIKWCMGRLPALQAVYIDDEEDTQSRQTTNETSPAFTSIHNSMSFPVLQSATSVQYLAVLSKSYDRLDVLSVTLPNLQILEVMVHSWMEIDHVMHMTHQMMPARTLILHCDASGFSRPPINPTRPGLSPSIVNLELRIRVDGQMHGIWPDRDGKFTGASFTNARLPWITRRLNIKFIEAWGTLLMRMASSPTDGRKLNVGLPLDAQWAGYPHLDALISDLQGIESLRIINEQTIPATDIFESFPKCTEMGKLTTLANREITAN
ncbi:hypothetical protein CYLTODRAFT_493844 [Cylindrobasidium torrendii FP15055 ss-10]|uniref:F-box domain-containing protein n=1 Tax=Cylindrobasidium torrendii FP15055 ss-10 TaxID=1314674 RepID=A0A0D7AZX9_9AGAR|nr:hypothetical protein CYLTODRAFT_493844 [Cylindrobasidium torrendii FP15055 ss-10]